MKSLVKFINENVDFENNQVIFVKVDRDAGIMFGDEESEMEPESVETLCNEIGLDYEEEGYDDIDVPVYFWNITRNTGSWVSRGKCKPIL